MVVNVQYDQPLIDPLRINAVADTLNTLPHASLGTAAHAIESEADMPTPNW